MWSTAWNARLNASKCLKSILTICATFTSFTREKVRAMLNFIMQEPEADADRDRGHTIPFHSDMIF